MDILFGNTKIKLNEDAVKILFEFYHKHQRNLSSLFIAQDYDGVVFVYHTKPEINEVHNCWETSSTKSSEFRAIQLCSEHVESWRSRCTEITTKSINDCYLFS